MKEIRFLQTTEIRATGGGTSATDPLIIEGYAAVFGVNAQLPKFREKVMPGSFSRAIETKADVVCLFNHDVNYVLGRTTAGTLTLRQTDKGLQYTCILPNTENGRSLHESIRRGDINGCSFAFTIPEGGQDWSEERDADGTYFIQRAITDVNLLDVSPVTHPCYTGTNVDARYAAEAPAELRSAVDAKNEALKSAVVNPPADVVAAVEKREGEEPAPEVVVVAEESFEDQLQEINNALQTKFPALDAVGAPVNSGPCYNSKYYVCDTFDGYVIAVENATGDHFQIPYSEDADENIVFGEPVAVEQVWVPSDRCKKAEAEFRAKFPLAEKRDEEDDLEDDLEDEFELGLIGRAFDESKHSANHEDFGMCSDPLCACQNRWCPTGSRDTGDRSAFTPEMETRCQGAETSIELRGGMTRTKRVAGKDLSAKSFAFVGDPDKTETWKLPIHDASHVRNALARFDQTDGIPADKKAGVLAKIHAAAKKFGIDVAAEKKAAEDLAEKRAAEELAEFNARVDRLKASFDPTCTSVRYSRPTTG